MVILQFSADDFFDIAYRSAKKAIKDELGEQLKIKPSQEENIYLTKKQAAQIANVSTSTIDNWGRAGYITRHYFGSSVRFNKEELLEYLGSKKVTNIV